MGFFPALSPFSLPSSTRFRTPGHSAPIPSPAPSGKQLGMEATLSILASGTLRLAGLHWGPHQPPLLSLFWTLWLLIFLDHMFYAGETAMTSPYPRADLAEALLPP